MSTSEKTLGELGYLTYSSSAVQRFSQAELKKLLEISRHNNSLRGVTGMLLYREGQFLQYLEGPRETVNDTFERIKKDDRHYGSQIVAQGPLPGRIFPEWSMGYKSLAGVRSRNTPGYSECLQPTFRPSGEGVLQVALCGLTVLLRRFGSSVAPFLSRTLPGGLRLPRNRGCARCLCPRARN